MRQAAGPGAPCVLFWPSAAEGAAAASSRPAGGDLLSRLRKSAALRTLRLALQVICPPPPPLPPQTRIQIRTPVPRFAFDAQVQCVCADVISHSCQRLQHICSELSGMRR